MRWRVGGGAGRVVVVGHGGARAGGCARCVLAGRDGAGRAGAERGGAERGSFPVVPFKIEGHTVMGPHISDGMALPLRRPGRTHARRLQTYEHWLVSPKSSAIK
jgi:hypothetical protein